MKSKILNLTKFICFLVILFIGIFLLSKAMMREGSIAKRQGFYETGKNSDVLILGSSLVINGIYPKELWKEYGIDAYNLGGHAEYIGVNYWNLVNALQYGKPKLVIIDVSKCGDDAKCYEENLSYLHSSIDAMPLSAVKIRALRDLVPGHELEFIFPFMLYHSRWEEMIHWHEDIIYNDMGGAESREGVTPMDRPEIVDDIYDGKETISMEYLRKIADLCENNDIELLFINMPYYGNDQKKTNYIQKIADEYKINYYNIFREEYELLDYSCDFYDEYHLNPSGAEKITDNLGKYIKNNYTIQDEK